jgi:chromosome segregation ATPase
MAEVIVVGDDDEGIVDARTLWRPKYVAEKQARETVEAQTTQLLIQNDQLRTEAAIEKRARETAEAQTTQLLTQIVQLRTEAAREKRARETAEAQLQKLSNELESTKATVRELQSAIDALREELTLAATAQGKQEKKGTAMAQRERLGPEVAIAAGTSTQLQKVRAVMMEVQAQVTVMDAIEAFTQARLDASRGKVQTPVSASGAAPRQCNGRKQ